jgi:hypothetical protein
VNIVVGLAREHIFGVDFTNGKFAGRLAPRACSDTNVPIGDDPRQFTVGAEYREHTAVVNPHQFHGLTDIHVGTATDGTLSHDLFNFHSGLIDLSAMHVF